MQIYNSFKALNLKDNKCRKSLLNRPMGMRNGNEGEPGGGPYLLLRM
jgi:hypothetical protein